MEREVVYVLAIIQRAERADSLGMAGGLAGKNALSLFLTFDHFAKIVILHALLAVSMTNILLV